MRTNRLFKISTNRQFRWKRLKSDDLSSAQRNRIFVRYAPLVLIPALFAIPVWMLLVRNPRFPGSETVAMVLFAAFAVMVAIGTPKMVRCMRVRELDLTTAMAFGVLLILCTMIASGFFLYFAVRHGAL